MTEPDQPYCLPLPEHASVDGCWLMVNGEVNIDDLLHSRPGRIIRMENPDSLRYVPGPMDNYDRLAGMVSDAA
jgi:hypothetical protein